jgi:hypothetical protein
VTTPNPFAAPAPQAAPEPAPAVPNPFGPGTQAAPAPQAYAPPAPVAPAPQQYAPHPAPQGQYGQTAAPAPSYAPPAPQGYAGPALNMDALRPADAPSPSGSGTGAKIADMYDRLVLVFPHTVETVNRSPQFITPEQRAKGQLTEERVVATVVVLDMGPGTSPAGAFIDFGGAPYQQPPIPHTTREPLPYVRRSMWITQSKLVEQLKPHLPAAIGAQGMVAGRVVKQGTDRNSPWYLAGATESELALCRQYMEGVAANYFPHPLAG